MISKIIYIPLRNVVIVQKILDWDIFLKLIIKVGTTFFRVYTEEQPGDAAIMLFIKDLREEDSGTYRCSGIYATNEEMHAQVDISTFSKFFEKFYLTGWPSKFFWNYVPSNLDNIVPLSFHFLSNNLLQWKESTLLLIDWCTVFMLSWILSLIFCNWSFMPY